MAFTYDLATEIGKVRRLIPDVINTAEEPAMFQDEEIGYFLAEEDGVKRAAALALEVISSDQALVLKVMRVQNIQTDGAKLAAELRARAAGLRRQADDAEADAGDLFQIAEQVQDPFSARERLAKEALRHGV